MKKNTHGVPLLLLTAAISEQVFAISASDDSATTYVDTPINIDAVANDEPIPDFEAKVVTFTQPAYGSVVLNNDGTFTYTPNQNFEGQDFFSYEAGNFFNDNDVPYGFLDNAFVTIDVVAAPETTPLHRW